MRTHYVTLSLIAAAASAASANIIVNGDFETMPNFGAGVQNDAGFSALTGAQIPGWTIEANHAATVHNTVLYPTISGGFSINTDGEGFGGNNANFYQDFATTLGTSYTLEFDYQGWQNNGTPHLDISLVDTLNAAVLANGNYTYDATLHHELFNFVGTGNPLRLRIQELPQSGFNDNAFMVDNFAVNAVPAPAAGLILGLGGLMTRRRHR